VSEPLCRRNTLKNSLCTNTQWHPDRAGRGDVESSRPGSTERRTASTTQPAESRQQAATRSGSPRTGPTPTQPEVRLRQQINVLGRPNARGPTHSRPRALRPHRSLPRAVRTARPIRLDANRQQRDPQRPTSLEPDRRLALRPRRRRGPVRRRGERHGDELPGRRHRLDGGGRSRGGPRSPRWDPVDVDTIAVRTALSESASTPIPDRIRPRTVTRPFVVGDHRLETDPGEPFVRCTACGWFRSKDAITGRDHWPRLSRSFRSIAGGPISPRTRRTLPISALRPKRRVMTDDSIGDSAAGDTLGSDPDSPDGDADEPLLRITTPPKSFLDRSTRR